ncbi:MAG: FAD-dependent oxidoreductase [Kiritimatiellae bacterium]|nr:FAD-dependent oxidoreductase [Kiritimatiellia bacterium]MDW8459527.1 FAD-dependent oxidoreductase [Verrucomicrobiota bacterium]
MGAGLTALGVARHLSDAVIFEASDHVGGHAYSHEQHGVFFDEGAHICHAKDEAWLKLLYAQAGAVRRIEQSRVGCWWHGHWLTYPVQNHLRDLPADLRIRALDDLVKAQVAHQGKTAANYEEWCRFQYGDYLTDQFYREYTDKYWRVPMAEMGTDWLAGRLLPSQLSRIIHGAIAPLDEKQAVFSLFHYPERGGFFAFFKGLYEGLDIRLNRRAVCLDCKTRTIGFADGSETRYESLVSTIPLKELVAITVDAPPEVREAAVGLRCTQLLCVNLVIEKSDLTPYDWFYIYDADIDVARVKVTSNVAPNSVPTGTTVLQTEQFVRDDESFDIPARVAKTVRDLARVLKFDPERMVRAAAHVHVRHAYPIPMQDREERARRIIQWYESRGVYPAGLFGRWKYLWSDQAYSSGRELAASLSASVKG